MWPSHGCSSLLLCLLFCQVATLLYPEHGRTQDLDRFMVRGGANFIWDADTNMSLRGEQGVGGIFNFSDALKGEQTATVPRVDSLFRFTPKHSIGFTYYRVDRDGFNTIDRSIDFGNVTFPIGATVKSNFDVALYEIYYMYSFYHTEKVELAALAGFYFTDISVSLTSVTTVGTSINAGTTSRTDLLAPLPQVGFLMRYYITPRLNAELRTNFFYVDSSRWRGSLAEIYFGLEYRLFKHFGFGGAVDRLNASIEGPVGESATLKVDNAWNTAFVYGSFYF